MSLRIQRVRELIRRELSTILEREFSFGGCLVTVHDVDPTQDLKQCFVYIGIIGNEGNEKKIIAKLMAERPFIQKRLYKRVTLRNSPQLFFRLDQSIERGVKVVRAIEDLPPPAEDNEEEDSESHD